MMLAYNDPLTNIKMSLTGDLQGFKQYEKNCSHKVIELTFMSAIHNGNLDCIKYMIDNGFVDITNKPYCDIAVKKGNYECLRYLHQNGCKFNKYTGLIAMIREDNKCLKYILQNGGDINMPPE